MPLGDTQAWQGCRNGIASRVWLLSLGRRSSSGCSEVLPSPSAIIDTHGGEWTEVKGPTRAAVGTTSVVDPDQVAFVAGFRSIADNVDPLAGFHPDRPFPAPPER